LKTVYIALGSNIGDRAANLAEARRRMERLDIAIVRESSIYETAPWGYLEQPRFLNQVVEAATNWMPRQLISRLKQVERGMGRRQTVRNGPRNIDLDILLYGDAIVSAPGLEIPHPRMGERRFVLEPLTQLAGDLRHPRTGATIRQMLAAVADQGARRWRPEE
jgi:2-amino-4-hydroxy-6-hydroxymethyldihydropteridine diphosphokinase